jgi:leucyl aminopeptidase
MLDLLLSDNLAELRTADLIVVPFFAAQDGIQLAVPAALAGTTWLDQAVPAQAVTALRRDQRFTAARGQIAPALLLSGTAGGPDLLAVGLGPDQVLDHEALCTLAQAVAQATAGRQRVVTCLSLLGADRAQTVRAIAEGSLLGRYRFNDQPAAKDATSMLLLVAPGEHNQEPVRSALRQGTVIGRNANWVRRLVDTPPRDLPPAKLAETIAERGRDLGFGVEIWDRDQMLAQNFGGTAAVGAASINQPRVVVLRGAKHGTRKPLGLAGKGITFDSGGINLKRNLAEIFRMKGDMAAAAAVAGALFSAAELGTVPDVIAVLPMAENMPGGNAQRPGDILTHPGGKRTEVIDTDCEGRLILADAIAYLAGQDVEGIIDIGTLTDGGGVGPLLWGCWATNDALVAKLLAAGLTAGEPGWRLPLRPEYVGVLSSTLADIANAPLSVPDIGLTAATYLRAFVGDTPWVHIDNGSSAFMENPIAAWQVGATGSPMRALLQLLRDRS